MVGDEQPQADVGAQLGSRLKARLVADEPGEGGGSAPALNLLDEGPRVLTSGGWASDVPWHKRKEKGPALGS